MEMGMTVEAQEARRKYKRQYRRKNRDRINRQQREWRANNLEKAKEYQKRYWEKAAAKAVNIRASYQDYGITPERLNELIGIVRSGKYDAVVLSAARKADERATKHIIMSVKENASYEALEAKRAAGKIERIALGRSDFYGVRRLFFHYLDCELRGCSDTELENVKEG